jgi:uncharacterized membrane protein YdjX (TVP38/TMEM64 family)
MNRETDPAPAAKARGHAGLGRWLPLLVVAAAMVAFFASGLGRYLTFQGLAEHRDWLAAEVARLGFAAPLLFILVYAALVAMSVPAGAILTLTGGFLFGPWLGGLYSLVAATLGGTVVFLIARTSLGDLLRRCAGPYLRKLEVGFRENAASYLLVLRLVPLFPFWLVNLVPALLGVSLRTFVLGSFFGMAPGCFVYASLGAGIGTVIAAGRTPDLGIILQWRVLGPLLAMAALACVPILYKRYARGRQAPS